MALIVVAATISAQMEVVRERAKSLGRIEFAYEGEFERLIDHRKPSKTPSRHSFSGRIAVDTTQPIILKEHHRPQGETLSINKLSMTPKHALLIQSLQNKMRSPNQLKYQGGFLAAVSDQPHSIGVWFPTASFAIASDEESKKSIRVGEEEREGRRCLILAYKNLGFEYKFWVDLERNGLVLAAEYWTDKRRSSTMRCVDFKSFAAKDRSVWLPTTVVTEAYGRRNANNDGWEETATPSCRWSTRIVLATLKIDDEVPRPAEVKLNRKEPIQDYTAGPPLATPSGPKSVHAPPPPVHRSSTKREVLQTITDADVQKAELQATLRPPPVDWTSRIGLGLVLVGVLGAGYVWYRNLRAAV